MNAPARVLVAGAGITGTTAAWWLRRHGFEPRLLERRPTLDEAGWMIDFYGSGFDVAERMGLRGALDARHVPVDALEFVDARGRRCGSLSVPWFRALLGGRHVNFPRGALESVLHEAVAGVPLRCGAGVVEVEQDADGVRVRLSDGSVEEGDLLVGADGVHSTVRRLLWADTAPHERPLGYRIAGAVLDDDLGQGSGAFRTHVAPGLQAGLYPLGDGRLASFFAWRSDAVGTRDRAEHARALREATAGRGWIVPELAEATVASPTFWGDVVAQVEVAPWWKGRVVLAGDACQCLTLLAGQGASMGMAGAWALAEALAAHRDDPTAAFAAYEARLRPEIVRRQAEARALASSFVPSGRLAILAMLIGLRLLRLPGLGGLIRRRIGADSLVP